MSFSLTKMICSNGTQAPALPVLHRILNLISFRILIMAKPLLEIIKYPILCPRLESVSQLFNLITTFESV